MAAWRAEREAFERLRPTLERRYPGCWVAIHGGRVVGFSRDYERLLDRTWKKIPGEVFFIARIGVAEIIHMPGFQLP